MDEADAFLAVRGSDLQRTALVSIFLRRLEYFRGVLILITNHPLEIDLRFKVACTSNSTTKTLIKNIEEPYRRIS
ncbi:hypothetical protein OIDMADRAFT_19445 [Oidiodendron maius Zn]|uniref:ATPase AAA-type core domain-containing protein n=1 Tax=Oidiodendron maius (strain Zn) TaxID=913774 RepID=A0A0C3HAL4_OIDMZ|nr:hypothetical protein OIDMADRAFT_19445 [Oidiodendron maius Zn]